MAKERIHSENIMKERTYLNRVKELALVFSGYFERASNPFSSEVLLEHNVTADECFSISNYIAEAIRFYSNMPDPKIAAKGLVLQKLLLENRGTSVEDRLRVIEFDLTLAETILEDLANRVASFQMDVPKLNFRTVEAWGKTVNNIDLYMRGMKSFTSLSVLKQLTKPEKEKKHVG